MNNGEGMTLERAIKEAAEDDGPHISDELIVSNPLDVAEGAAPMYCLKSEFFKIDKRIKDPASPYTWEDITGESWKKKAPKYDYSWLIFAVDRHGSGWIIDGAKDFFDGGLLDECSCEDNGVIIPPFKDRLFAGLYKMSSQIFGDGEEWEIGGKIELLHTHHNPVEAQERVDTHNGKF